MFGVRKLFILALIVFFINLVSCLKCRDENNEPVDWFVLYKLPRLRKNAEANVRNGVAYMIITSKTSKGGWKLSKKSIVESDTALAFTLSPYYKNISGQSWLFYNDNPPGHYFWKKKGHTKGVVGGEAGGGFWLVHSLPRYPATRPAYAYPEAGKRNGQTFLCISLSQSQMDKLGPNVMEYNDPLFYEEQVNDVDYPSLAESINNTITGTLSNTSSALLSIGSTEFKVFAKGPSFGKDLYEWVGEELGSNLLVESWRMEWNPLPSNCKGEFKVINIGSITLRNTTYSGIDFSSLRDHSKWTISHENPRKWLCIGDINRASPQKNRGGGTVCTENVDLWLNFNKLVLSSDGC